MAKSCPEFPRLRTKGGWKIQAGAKLARATWINKLAGKGGWGIPSQRGAAARGPTGVSLPPWVPQWLQQLQGPLSLLPAACQREELGADAGKS